jgi:hypothetical protein
MPKIRKEVSWFAEWMEKNLIKNDYKGGWKHCSRDYLKNRFRQEVQEMLRQTDRIGFDVFWKSEVNDEQIDRLIMECADAANFLMMIADNAERLREKKDKAPK